MRLAIVPAAGRASRLGKKAPLGCKLLYTLPTGQRMGEHLRDLLAPHVDEVRFVVQSNVVDDPRLDGLNLHVDDTLDGPLSAVEHGGGFDADDLLVWYSDTLADTVPEGSDWVGLGYAQMRRPWEYPHGQHFVRGIQPEGSIVCAGAYAFSRPARLRDYDTMLDALNGYPGLAHRLLPGWLDLDDLPARVKESA